MYMTAQYLRPKYQVFVSSTFLDLQDARAQVFNTLYAMECIVAGMELFPAIDQEQFEFIKRVIDSSDYYLILLGGRYGTTSSNGLSFTELEYDYAVSKGLKVVALLHDSPQSLPMDMCDTNPELVQKLEAFRKKIRDGRLVRTWNKPSDLPGLVSVALQRTMTIYPARGWVRGDTVPSEEIYAELNALRAERELLRSQLDKAKYELQSLKAQRTGPTFDDVRSALSQTIKLSIEAKANDDGVVEAKDIDLKLGDIFVNAGLKLFESTRQPTIKSNLETWLCSLHSCKAVEIQTKAIESIAYRFESLGLIRVDTEFEEREYENWRAVFRNSGRRPLEKIKYTVAFWSVTAMGRDLLAGEGLPLEA